ncbi:hypothetical protein Cgig2_016829 [Carnegiea gigantea]|uniref:Aminotransferase-like plant mobile domain-containing protein n=1 Tax=Carnegiea gigantea TaxID=171969 RepID=A0A9Q1KAF7_9CARY|nr:hypothetical protein Cgig2_016829 [Carnegiea gigantea]
MDGSCGSQKAPNENGDEYDCGPDYQRSIPLRDLEVNIPFDSKVFKTSWFKRDRIRKGTLEYTRNEEYGYIDVNTEAVKKSIQSCDIFYPPFAKLFKNKRNWGLDFQFHGCATYKPGIMEWTAYILAEFEGTLQAGVFGAVGVSQFPYHFNCDVWRAFCELLGPLMNTLHHGAGEIGISLYDLERISGLPVIGDVYKEFLPRNDILCDPTKYPSTVAELLCIHAELCRFHKRDYIFCNWWLDHFYRGELTLAAREYEGGQPKSKKNSPPQVSSRPRMTISNVTREGELIAFITFWLSHFALPHGRYIIRPETFVMAALLAMGHRLSLAPTVLGYPYHGLGQAANHLGHPGEAGATLPIHYVIGWLVELFPCLYSHHPDRKCPKEYPILIRYAGDTHTSLSLSQARHMFRDQQFVYLRVNTFLEDSRTGRDLIDMGLSNDDFRYLLFIRSSVLPIRVASELILEPYYPNRFAHQFGFDQGVPSNNLNFSRHLRQRRNVMDLAQAFTIFCARDTRARFRIPYNWVQESILKGIEVIIDINSNQGSARELLASRVRVFQSFSALCSMIDIYNLKIFGVVETTVKIEDLVDIDRVKALSDQDLTCSSEITHIEDQLNNLYSEASKLKVKEQEVLREEEQIRKMREDLNIQQQVLLEAEGKLKSSLDLKKKEAEQVKADLAEARFS